MNQASYFIGVKKSDGFSITHAGHAYPNCFPKLFESKKSVGLSCMMQVKHYKKHKYSYISDGHRLMPGDEVMVYEIPFDIINGVPQTNGFKFVGTLFFDPQLIRMRWL